MVWPKPHRAQPSDSDDSNRGSQRLTLRHRHRHALRAAPTWPTSGLKNGLSVGWHRVRP